MKRSILPLLTFSSLCAALVGIAPSQEPDPERDYTVDPLEWGVYNDAFKEYTLLKHAQEPETREQSELAKRVDELRARLAEVNAEFDRLRQQELFEEAKRAKQEARNVRDALHAAEQERSRRTDLDKWLERAPTLDIVFEQRQDDLDREKVELQVRLNRLEQEAVASQRVGDLALAEKTRLEATALRRAFEELVAQERAQEPQDSLYNLWHSQRQSPLRLDGRLHEDAPVDPALPGARSTVVDYWRHTNAPDPRDAEAAARVHHLRVAAESLAAAGMYDEANELIQRADALAAERAQKERETRHANPLAGEVAELTEMVHDLRGQVVQMRDMIEELRAQVRDLRSGR